MHRWIPFTDGMGAICKEKQLRAALTQTTARLAGHFANEAAAQTAPAYLQSLLSNVERKNSWQLAEVAGLQSPCRFQHLLGRGTWEADDLRDEQLGGDSAPKAARSAAPRWAACFAPGSDAKKRRSRTTNAPASG